MNDFKKISKTLLIATALSGVMITSSLMPAVGEFTGQQAFAQSFPLASQERADAAQAAKDARPQTRSPAFSERAYRKLSKAQEFMEAEPAQYAEAMAELQSQDLERINGTERASFLQLMAAVQQNLGDTDQALGYYKQILAIEGLSYALTDQITFIVGQIEFSNGNYDLARTQLEAWFKYQPTPSITNIVVLANVYYASGIEEGIPEAEAETHYRTAIEYLNWAIVKAKADGKEDKENWYAVLRAIHNSLDETDKVLEYAELLASRWPKKSYFTQLSGLYAQAAGEDGLSEEEARILEKKQLAAYELVYRQGLLESGREHETMAQLYLYHESPYQSAKTLSGAIEEGVSEKTRRNYDLLASGYVTSKDLDKAVDPLIKAADMAEDGNLYLRLANVYLNLDSYEEATDAINKALNKGGLRRPDQSRLLQGQAYLALERFEDARSSFREAAKDDRSEAMARNLLRYVDAEEKRIKDIREYLS